MIKEILDYHRLERVADVGRMQILSYILLCFLLGQTFLFGNGVLSLTLWVFVFTIQKLRRVYFEEHSIMRYAPLPRRDIIQNLLIKSYFYLLLTLMIDMSVTYEYMIYMYSQSSMPVRFTLFTGEVIILIIAVINLYPTLHEKTGDLILLIAQSPYFYLYLIVAGILAIGTSVAGIQLFSSKIYQA